MSGDDIVDELQFRSALLEVGGHHTAREVMSDITAMEKARTEIVRLRAEVERLTNESKEWDDDTERHVARMAGLLHDTANALHGGPLPGGMWSWHDLPNLASAERALADQLAEALGQALCGDVGAIDLADAALIAWQEARRER